MKWFDKWFTKKCKEAWNSDSHTEVESWEEPVRLRHKNSTSALSSGPKTRQFNNNDGMNFTIHNANGGYILEYSSYDSKNDLYENRLHVIQSDTDLGQGIAHIITFEMLRK